MSFRTPVYFCNGGFNCSMSAQGSPHPVLNLSVLERSMISCFSTMPQVLHCSGILLGGHYKGLAVPSGNSNPPQTFMRQGHFSNKQSGGHKLRLLREDLLLLNLFFLRGRKDCSIPTLQATSHFITKRTNGGITKTALIQYKYNQINN